MYDILYLLKSLNLTHPTLEPEGAVKNPCASMTPVDCMILLVLVGEVASVEVACVEVASVEDEDGIEEV